MTNNRTLRKAESYHCFKEKWVEFRGLAPLLYGGIWKMWPDRSVGRSASRRETVNEIDRKKPKDYGVLKAETTGERGKKNNDVPQGLAYTNEVCRRSNTCARARGSSRTTIVYNNYDGHTVHGRHFRENPHAPFSSATVRKIKSPSPSPWRDMITVRLASTASVPLPHFK